MLPLEQIVERLSDRNLSTVAERIGMQRQQLWAIASGANKNPTTKTLQRISDYLEAEKWDSH